MKTIKRLYGGDASNQKELQCGDIITIDLIDYAISEFLPTAYILKERIDTELTDIQLMQIKPRMGEMYAMLYFLPIKTYKSNKRVQEAKLTCGDKTIKIYTSKE